MVFSVDSNASMILDSSDSLDNNDFIFLNDLYFKGDSQETSFSGDGDKEVEDNYLFMIVILIGIVVFESEEAEFIVVSIFFFDIVLLFEQYSVCCGGEFTLIKIEVLYMRHKLFWIFCGR